MCKYEYLVLPNKQSLLPIEINILDILNLVVEAIKNILILTNEQFSNVLGLVVLADYLYSSIGDLQLDHFSVLSEIYYLVGFQCCKWHNHQTNGNFQEVEVTIVDRNIGELFDLAVQGFRNSVGQLPRSNQIIESVHHNFVQCYYQKMRNIEFHNLHKRFVALQRFIAVDLLELEQCGVITVRCIH